MRLRRAVVETPPVGRQGNAPGNSQDVLSVWPTTACPCRVRTSFEAESVAVGGEPRLHFPRLQALHRHEPRAQCLNSLVPEPEVCARSQYQVFSGAWS